MSKELNFRKSAELLKAQDNFLIITHKNPDGDTAGSAAALCSALRRMGKTAYLYPNRQMIAKIRDYAEKFFAPEGFEPAFIVAVDVAANNMFPQGFDGSVDFCVDHHPTNNRYAKNLLLKAERSSCGEAVLELIYELIHSVTKEEATLLYMAVSTDTGCFQYNNTNSATLKTAAKLLELGAENVEINTRFFRKISNARMKLEGLMYSNMSSYRDGKVVIICVTRDMMAQAGATADDMDDLAGIAGRAESAVVSITIKEQEDGTSKVSVRTTKEVSASAICAVFGGGGHEMASGCAIPCAPEKAKEMLAAVVDEIWK